MTAKNWLVSAAVIVALAAIVDLTACSRTENGDIVVKRPADVSVKTTEDTVHVPNIRVHVDTVNTPSVGMQAETLVVKKPVVGAKRARINLPKVKY